MSISSCSHAASRCLPCTHSPPIQADDDEGADAAEGGASGGGVNALLLEAASLRKERGNVAFGDGRVAEALSYYRKALSCVRWATLHAHSHRAIEPHSHTATQP
jgi:prepilin-type processing-associated H-X9-DG protein